MKEGKVWDERIGSKKKSLHVFLLLCLNRLVERPLPYPILWPKRQQSDLSHDINHQLAFEVSVRGKRNKRIKLLPELIAFCVVVVPPSLPGRLGCCYFFGLLLFHALPEQSIQRSATQRGDGTRRFIFLQNCLSHNKQEMSRELWELDLHQRFFLSLAAHSWTSRPRLSMRHSSAESLSGKNPSIWS